MLMVMHLVASVAFVAPISKRDGDFVLSAVPIAAIQDGPIVIRVELRYLGLTPTSIRVNPVVSKAQLRLPRHFLAEVKAVSSIPDPIDVPLVPGDTLVEFECLHQWHVAISSKSEVVEIGWRVVGGTSSGRRGAVLANPEVTMVLRTTKATQRVVDAFCRNYLTHLSQASVTDKCSGSDCGRWLEVLTDPVYLPTMIRALDLLPSDEQGLLLNTILRLNCRGEELSQRLATALVQEKLTGAMAFTLWTRCAVPRPEGDKLNALLTAPNPWVRALAALAFPEDEGAKTVKEVFDELTCAYSQTLSPVVTRLVTNCDDRRWHVREKAMWDLIALGEYASVPLRGNLYAGLSPEAHDRVTRALTTIADDPLREAPRAVWAIQSMTTESAREFLTLLKDGRFGVDLSELGKRKHGRAQSR